MVKLILLKEGDFIIDELIEVKDYINGKKINKRCLYRTCVLIARYFANQGLDFMSIQKNMFSWGKNNNVYIPFNVNRIIKKELSNPQKLKTGIKVFVSNNDIEEINNRFQTKNSRIAALGILCYSKVFADEDGFMNLSLSSLSNWIGVNYYNMSSRYIPELITCGYIDKDHSSSDVFSWDSKIRSKNLRIHINVPHKNVGEFELKDDDIINLYKEIFD